jgi:ferredoxin-NADP reductase
LTAADGYQAQRSYSIASPPEADAVALTVERVPDGEVSGWLAAEARAGDVFDLRGPIGGYFVWHAGQPGRLQLIAGGSGAVPLLAMLRHRVAAGGRQPVRVLYSARTIDDVIARAELDGLAARDDDVAVTYTLTRAAPQGWWGPTRRVDTAMLREVLWPGDVNVTTFVCGPTPFVESVATGLIALSHAPDRVRTERFGPTGGP